MTSAQHPNRVYFSSFDRSPVDSNTDFTITFDTPIDKARNFEVVSASFPNSFHQFAPYETVFYFYHEDFNGGGTAIGVPLSVTQFLGIGATGENAVPASRPTGRKQYIDGRYFLDGADVATYITAWIQSLSATGGTDFPASSTGLCPFYHIDDDPTQPIVYFANEAATGVNFSQLSLVYDDTTSAGGEGSLKMLFEDATPKIVRVASAVDVGVLNGTYNYPSLLGYKLGFTDLEQEAFGAVVNITSANNQFQLNARSQVYAINSNIPNNRFNIIYTDRTSGQPVVLFGTVSSVSSYSISDIANALSSAVSAIISSGPVSFRVVGSAIQGLFTVPAQVGTTVFIDFSVGGSQLFSLLNVASGQIAIGTGSAQPNTSANVNTGNLVLNAVVDNFRTISIPPPATDFTVSGLIAALNQQIQPLDIIQSFCQNFSVSSTGSQLEFNFTLSGNEPFSAQDFQIIFGADPVQQATETTLGFTANITTTNPNTTVTAPNNVVTQGSPTPDPHVAPDPIDLIRTSNIYFASSLSAGEALSSAGRKDILFSVSLTAPVGGVQLYQSSLSGIIVNRPPDVIRNLRLTLLDDNFQIMEPMPQNSAVSVEIHFAYADENMVNNVSTNPYAY